MPFKRPTDHYDERIHQVDEKLCELIRQRKEISNNNPGFPPLELISDWAKKYNLYDDMLRSIFGSLWHEDDFKSFVEPEEFRVNLPVMKFVQKDNRMFSVVYIRQYNNASVVNFNIDNDYREEPYERPQHRFYKLFTGPQYDCRMISGGGSSEHMSYSFVVSPPLPDNFSGIDLIFREYVTGEEATGLEIVIHLE
jgi:hypothetical protein